MIYLCAITVESKIENSTKENIILFEHGAWHGAWCWEKYFVKQFSERGFECYTFDLPKHNKPRNVRNINSLTINNYVEALKIEVKRLDQSPIIIGRSMGGLFLQKMLRDRDF